MVLHKYPFLLLVGALVLATTGCANIVNTRVELSIDATGGIGRTVASVYMRNDGATPVSEVSIAAPADIGAIVVLDGDRVVKGASRLGTKKGGPVSGGAESGVLYAVTLKSEIAPGEEKAIVIAHELLDAVKPAPVEITSGESQFVTYSGNAYFYSPYRTLSLSGKVKMASKPQDGWYEAPEPAKLEKSSLELGPYEDLAPFSMAPISARFKSNRGILVAKEAVRDMYVSHWGNVAVREEFEVENAAARHVGEWSRADYQNPMSNSRSNTAIGDVWANLPREATNVMYKDLVGNITTSRLRKPGKTSRPIQLTFRFPLLGGWKNHFWYTYDVPLGVFARSSGSSHRLKVPVFPSINEDFVCRRLRIRVLLPEGASNVRVQQHSSIAFETSQTVERTTLNYFGRTVVTLTAKGIFTNSALHASNIVFTYDFTGLNLLVTPAFVASGIFALFLAFISLAGTDVALVGEKDDPATRQLALFADQEFRIVAAIRAIDEKYVELDELSAQLTSSKVASETLLSQRLEIESSLKAHEGEISQAAAMLKQLGGPSVEIANALASRLSSKRDTSMQAISAHLMFLEGRMNNDTYEKQLNTTFAPTLVSLAQEIESLVGSLSDDM